MKIYLFIFLFFLPALFSQCTVTYSDPGDESKPRCSVWKGMNPENTIQIQRLDLRYDLTNSYIDSKSFEELSRMHSMSYVGSFNHLFQLFPDEYLLKDYTGDDRPQYKVDVKLSDCFGAVTYDYGAISRDDVMFNDIAFDRLRVPYVPRDHFASFSAVAKTIKTKGSSPTRIVWEISMDDFDFDDFKFDSDGTIDETKTKVHLDIDGIITTSDDNDSIYGRMNGDYTGHSHGNNDLYHEFIPDDSIRPVNPDSDENDTSEMQTITPIDNSSFIFSGTVVEAENDSSISVSFKGEPAPISSVLMKQVYSNGEYSTTVEWDRPLKYIIIKKKNN